MVIVKLTVIQFERKSHSQLCIRGMRSFWLSTPLITDELFVSVCVCSGGKNLSAATLVRQCNNAINITGSRGGMLTLSFNMLDLLVGVFWYMVDGAWVVFLSSELCCHH